MIKNHLTRKEDITVGLIVGISLLALLIVATIYEFN